VIEREPKNIVLIRHWTDDGIMMHHPNSSEVWEESYSFSSSSSLLFRGVVVKEKYSRFIVSLILISSGDSDTDESFRASFCCGIMRSLFSDGWTCAFAKQSKKSSALAS
jgi:hypothetical protein